MRVSPSVSCHSLEPEDSRIRCRGPRLPLRRANRVGCRRNGSTRCSARRRRGGAFSILRKSQSSPIGALSTEGLSLSPLNRRRAAARLHAGGQSGQTARAGSRTEHNASARVLNRTLPAGGCYISSIRSCSISCDIRIVARVCRAGAARHRRTARLHRCPDWVSRSPGSRRYGWSRNCQD